MHTTERNTLAAILVQQHAALVVDEVTLPASLAPGQVLVQVHATSLCGSQLGEIDGVKGPDRYLPHLLGHEGSGVVEKVGPGVGSLQSGDHVVMHWRRGPGIEAQPPRYGWRGGTVQAGPIATFAERVVVSENRLTRIPADSDMALACLMGCATTTGLGAVFHDARVQPGESMVVLGSGGVGLSVVQGGSLVSAHPIVAVDRFASRCEHARSLGATHTLVADRPSIVEAGVRHCVGETGVDVVIETTGNSSLIELAYQMAAPEGRVVLVGVPHHDQRVSINTLALHLGKRLSGSHGGGCRPEKDIPRYLRLYAAGKLKLRELITESYPLPKINTAIDRLRTGEVVGRCLLTVAAGRT